MQSMPEVSPEATSRVAWQRIASSLELTEKAQGLRFAWKRLGQPDLPAFCVRFEGLARAFVNRCAHVPVELDWNQSGFFDESGQYLVCATHGACYLPSTGFCIAGPCKGKSLVQLELIEGENGVWVKLG